MADDPEKWDKKISIKRTLVPVAPLARNPIKFEPFRLYSGLAQERRVSIHDGKLSVQFLTEAEQSIQKALSDDAFLYGQLAESLFESLVVALGSVTLIKQEDTGAIYADDPGLKVPDFRIVLPDGARLLIEVKNFYQRQGLEEFILDESYVAGLQKYAWLDSSVLTLAIFWVRWNIWTLIPVSRIPFRDGARRISLGEAMKINCSAAIGDFMVATLPPLRIVIHSEPSTPIAVSDDRVTSTYKMKIKDVELYSAEARITDELDRKIFDFLREYGSWKEQEEIPRINEGTLEGIEFRWEPEEALEEDQETENEQPFRMIGSLSSMFSRWFRRQVLGADGKPKQTKVDVVPGFLGRLIPEGYHGKHLSLWLFVQRPNFDN